MSGIQPLRDGVMTFKLTESAAAFIEDRWGKIDSEMVHKIDMDVISNPGWVTFRDTRNSNVLMIPSQHVIGISWTKDPRHE